MANSSDHTAGDAQLIHLVTAVYLGLLAAIGVIGNLLVLATVARMSQMRHVTYILVSNLSAVGLLHCVLIIPMHVVHMAAGVRVWEGGGGVACKALAHLNFGLVLCLLTTSAAIAVCRYRTVTARHSTRHQTMPTATIIKLIFFIWAFPTLVTVSASPYLGFNALLSDCFFVEEDSAFWYRTMALAAPAIFSTLCMLTAYTLIIKKVRDSRIKVFNLGHKPHSITDNVVPESREDKTGSESEQRKEADVQLLNVQATSGHSRVGVVKIFTTMIHDDSLNLPSTSYTHDLYTTAPSVREPQSTKDVNSPVSGGNLGSSCYLQPSASGLFLEAGTTAVSSGKGMDTLSVPSRSLSRLSQDSPSVTTMRHDSVLSASSFSSSSSSMVQHEVRRRGKRRVRKELRLTVHLFLAFILFCLLYLPLCLAHVVHALHCVGREGWLVMYTLALSFASNAWLVYALLNQDFRRAFRALLRGRRSF